MDYVAFAAAGAALGFITSERGETTSGQAWRAATWAAVAVGGKFALDLLQGRAGAVRTGWDGDDDYGPPPPVVPPMLVAYPPPYQYAFYYACPDGYALDAASGQCIALGPPLEEPFMIEREILYLYPEMIAQYPELRFHPEQLFVFRPELRTRYAGVRSVTEIRTRYREIHHQAPPARPKTAPPPTGKGRGPARPTTPSAPTAPPSLTPAGTPPTAVHPAAPPTGVTPLAPPTGATPPTGVTPMPPPTHPAMTAPPPGPTPSAPPSHIAGYYVWE